ncbi:DedA family protein [Nocardioides sp. Kera G14]|uniref:DedA family protein n=1 Tax=Nocardioides sp. Kera G14 TaxID=2884264 RepID=UPI001D0FA0AA|nr:DedA family protein [Nocardioides sp. Kera G14]UDY23185.1 DedA family protein [Nocardioides sp. Kera G14]
MHDLIAAAATQLAPLLSVHDFTQWLSPDFLLGKFGAALFWVGIVVLFVECGLFFPFLPGDTLLFAMGLFIAEGKVEIIPGGHFTNLVFALIVYVIAAFAGNVVGYEIGARIGPRIYHRDGRIIKRKYLDQTSDFFEKHGSPALVAGRFVPFVRTYITLVAGVTRMDRRKFFVWSALGAAFWVVSITLVGYVLGKTFPSLGKYIDLLTYGLLAVTVVVLGIELLRKRHEDDPGLPAAYRDEIGADDDKAADHSR